MAPYCRFVIPSRSKRQRWHCTQLVLSLSPPLSPSLSPSPSLPLPPPPSPFLPPPSPSLPLLPCSLHGFLWLYASGRVYRKLRSSIRLLCSPSATKRQHRLTCNSVCGAHSPKAIENRPVPLRCKHLFGSIETRTLPSGCSTELHGAPRQLARPLISLRRWHVTLAR